MRNQANTGRTDVSFQVGDWVFLKLQPFWQVSIPSHQKTHKLSHRFYGPFQIAAKIGAVAYRLHLPPDAKLHNVFHVSKLKLFVGDPSGLSVPLPTAFINDRPLISPIQVLGQ